MKKNFIYEYKTTPFHIGISYSLYPIPHLHQNIEIVYVLSGNCTAYAENKIAHLKKGDLFVTFPNQIHHYVSTPGGEFYVLIVSPDILFGLKDTLFDFYPKSNHISLTDDDPLISLFEETTKKHGEYDKTIIAGLINQTMGIVLPKFKLKPRIKTETPALQTILSFCEENFSNTDFSLDYISDSLHISKYHISHLLNEKLKINFSSYINMLRVVKACSLLGETDKKIIDISEEVGFGSVRSFNRAFSETIGTTPLKYRNDKMKLYSSLNITEL